MIEIAGTAVLALLYLGINILAAAAFAWDKHKAKNNSWRTSETALLALAFLGPFGAYGAMKLCRHKTQKTKFWLVPFFLVIHVALFVYLLFMFG